MKLQILTNSECECFDACRAKHGYQYHELLRPIASSKPLDRGKFGHVGIAAGWKKAAFMPTSDRTVLDELAIETGSKAIDEAFATATDALFKTQPQNVDDLIDEQRSNADEAKVGVEHYFNARTDELATRVLLACEENFLIRLPNDNGRLTRVAYSGAIDLVTYDPDLGVISIEDHKFTTVDPFAYERKLALNTQLSGYWFAVNYLRRVCNNDPFWYLADECCKLHGLKLLEVLDSNLIAAYNVIMAKPWGAPSVNKDGSVSVAKCDTTAEIYRSALSAQQERGIEISDKQQVFLDDLSRRQTSRCHKFEFSRSEAELDRWRRETIVKAAQIRATEKNQELRIRNPGNCTKMSSYACGMAPVCLDPTCESIRRLSYRVASSPHEELEIQNGNAEENERW